jgi:hypothetical protein
LLAAALACGIMLLPGAEGQGPLAEFGISSYYLTLGESGLAPVTVRNPQPSADDIVLNLSGYSNAFFEYSCFPSECSISSSKRDMDILSVGPGEERTYYVRLTSAGLGEDFLTLEANSTSGPLTGSDTMSVRAGEPVSFPGLGGLAVLAIVALSCLMLLRD